MESQPGAGVSVMKKVQTLLDIKNDEVKITILALAVTFCHGVSNVYLFTTSHSLFLKVFDAQDLAYTYIGGALSVILVGSMYTWLQHKVSPTKLVVWTLIFLLLTLLGARGWLYLGQDKGPAAFLAVWAVAYSTLTYMSIWGLFGQLFDTRQAKRLFGLIGAGEFAADIVAGFITPVLVSAIGSINLILVAALGLFGSVVFTILISRAFSGAASPALSASAEEKTPAPKLSEMLKDRYALSLHLIWGLSLMVFYLMDMAFSDQVEDHFTDAMDPMASFLGVFFAVGSAVNMVVQTFFTGRVLDKVGILKALLLLPGLVLLGCVAMSSGVAFVPRFGLAMFAMTVGCKMFDYILRNAIHDPAFQVLYQPLPPAKRFALQSSVLTRAEPGAALIGGGLLLLGKLCFNVDAANVALIMIVILCVQMVFTFSLREKYLDLLMEALKKRRLGFSERQVWDEGGRHLLLGFLKSRHPGEVIYALSLMERNAPHNIEEYLPDLLLHPSPEVLKNVLARLEHVRTPSALPRVRAIMLDEAMDPSVRTAAVLAYAAMDEAGAEDTLVDLLSRPDKELVRAAIIGLQKHCGVEGIIASGERFMEMLNSPDPGDRKASARIMGAVGVSSMYRPLRRLLQDPSAAVRRAALASAEKLGNPRLALLLLPFLGRPDTRHQAIRAMAALGRPALADLSWVISDCNQPREVVLGVLKAVSLMPPPVAIPFLLEYLFHPDAVARSLILNRLVHLGYQPDNPEDRQLLGGLVRQESSLATWLLNCLKALQPGQDFGLLKTALSEESDRCRDRMLALASLFGPVQIRGGLHRGVIGSDRTSHAYALEMLDSFLPGDLKERIFPLLENLPQNERLEKLGRAHPGLEVEPSRVLEAVAGKEDVWISPWPRAVALYLMGKGGDPAYEALLSGLSGHRTPLLAETALWALSRIQSRGDHACDQPVHDKEEPC
jgi:AAA family ATP:ADP antiporter